MGFFLCQSDRLLPVSTFCGMIHKKEAGPMNQIRFIVSPRIMGDEKIFGPGNSALLHGV